MTTKVRSLSPPYQPGLTLLSRVLTQLLTNQQVVSPTPSRVNTVTLNSQKPRRAKTATSKNKRHGNRQLNDAVNTLSHAIDHASLSSQPCQFGHKKNPHNAGFFQQIHFISPWDRHHFRYYCYRHDFPFYRHAFPLVSHCCRLQLFLPFLPQFSLPLGL